MSDTPRHDDMQVRYAAAAGLDVHKMQVTATVRTHAGREVPVVETREFSALAGGLFLLVQWLLGLRVSGAVMEATGVYREKVYDILSDAGLDVMVVNAQHVKQIKGRKTDIADSVWLSRICQFGLGIPSLVLPKFFRDLRGLSRYRRALIEQRARSQLRIQKVLDRGGVRIGGILSRVTHSVNGRRILKGIIAGDACEDILGGLSWHVRKKLDLLGDALSFELDMQSRWILSDLLAQFDSDTARVAAANRRMEAALAPYEALVRLLETLPAVSAANPPWRSSSNWAPTCRCSHPPGTAPPGRGSVPGTARAPESAAADGYGGETRSCAPFSSNAPMRRSGPGAASSRPITRR